MAEKKQLEDTEVRQVSQEELEIAYQGPAVFSNKFFLSITHSGLRVAFAEQNGEALPAQFRTAVVLPYQDALQLSKLLQKAIDDNVQLIPQQKSPDA
ncbi:hypothetical protein [Pseudohoeflea coraliihabitans]|uniref:DUF3467 domain-containing protein n=1 Tax=Pseudohoeflea coraliihabitans TaxID=2860393 RepID=A0ABS6WQM4_9HYPH|nr:hypothetical protein [Pseudohoeflea sp. DP4N28-3]MBW3098075.1 hypothetical protein [Pseudohoeflea sp. DP4N28-3]